MGGVFQDMVKKALILAGGQGTRLRSVIKDVPKPMADISGKPFLEYLLRFVYSHGVREVVISCGYKHEIIKDYFKDSLGDMKIYYSIENEPLGTGGAIKKALEDYGCFEEGLFLLNGDTFFNISLSELYNFHKAKGSDLTVALKKIKDSDRYGSVKIDGNNRIIGFKEKKQVREAYINGGAYLIGRRVVKLIIGQELNLLSTFSFEKDFLEVFYNFKPKVDGSNTASGLNFYGLPYNEDAYFIDIGIPSDYEAAKKRLPEVYGGII